MRRLFIAVAALFAAFPNGECEAAERDGRQEQAMEPELVAVEFTGSAGSIRRLAEAISTLGWRIDARADRSLRILPPANYTSDHFGLLLDRIRQLGLRDLGLRLIGPNGPVGPEG